MLDVSLYAVTINNFRSFKNQTFVFPRNPGLKYLFGENLVEPRLGANGAGKSSFLDAIFWCLYGVSIKGIRTSGLVSWGEDRADVTVVLDIGNERYNIHRFGPPMKIELGSKLVDQTSIDNLLHLSKERFMHSVMFGQGVRLFPDLTTPERGELLNEVLNLQVWMAGSDKAGKEHTALQIQINGENTKLARINGQLDALPAVAELQKKCDSFESERATNLEYYTSQSGSWESERTKDIEQLTKSITKFYDDIQQKANAKIEEMEELELKNGTITLELDSLVGVNEAAFTLLKQEIAAKEKLLDAHNKKFIELEYANDTSNKKIKLWSEREECPECHRHIAESERQAHIVEERTRAALATSASKKEQEALKLIREELHGMSNLHDEWSKMKVLVQSRRENAMHTHRQNEWRIAQIEKELDALSKEKCPLEIVKERELNAENPYLDRIAVLKKAINPYFDEIQQLQDKLALLIEEKAVILHAIELLSGRQMAMEYWKSGFKRIRLFFIERVLAALQVEIAGALSSLGLEGWAVKLATETETKSGTTKLGVQIHIQSPTAEGAWEGWSGGETQRLRLAIALGLALLIQRAAGVRYTFTSFDEPTQHLSMEGVEDLLEALNNKAQMAQLQIWVVDHSALTYSGFSEIYKVTKTEEGSTIGMVN